jgi:hypothetical protein
LETRRVNEGYFGYATKCRGSIRQATQVFWHAPKKLTAPHSTKTSTANTTEANPYTYNHTSSLIQNTTANVSHTRKTPTPIPIDHPQRMADNTRNAPDTITTQTTTQANKHIIPITTPTTTPIPIIPQLSKPLQQ